MGLRSSLDVLSSIAVVVAAAAVVWSVFVKSSPSSEQLAQVEPVRGLSVDAARIRNVKGNGPIAIIEFSDFQCPYCRRHASETLPNIERELIDSGRARYIAMHFPLEEIHPLAIGAGEAAECAGAQGRFWEMREWLFANSVGLTADTFVEHAKSLGMNETEFAECTGSQRMLTHVRADLEEGRRLGVKATPLFFLGKVRPDGGVELVTKIRGAVAKDVFVEQFAKLDRSATLRDRLHTLAMAATGQRPDTEATVVSRERSN